MAATAKIVTIKRNAGIAGQFSVAVTVSFPEGDDCTAEFVGSSYGEPGPVIMVSPAGAQTFVTDPGRFGATFGEKWVRRFVEELGAE